MPPVSSKTLKVPFNRLQVGFLEEVERGCFMRPARIEQSNVNSITGRLAVGAG